MQVQTVGGIREPARSAVEGLVRLVDVLIYVGIVIPHPRRRARDLDRHFREGFLEVPDPAGHRERIPEREPALEVDALEVGVDRDPPRLILHLKVILGRIVELPHVDVFGHIGMELLLAPSPVRTEEKEMIHDVLGLEGRRKFLDLRHDFREVRNGLHRQNLL